LHERPHINRTRLAAIAVVIALISTAVLWVQTRDRWNSPEIKSAEQAEYATTGANVRAVGARILPTDPKLKVEPSPAEPKQVQPANPNWPDFPDSIVECADAKSNPIQPGPKL
jgi:hypothetical protein